MLRGRYILAIGMQTCLVILDPAIVCSKGCLRGSKNMQKGHSATAIHQDLLQFELPSLLAPAALRKQPRRRPESSAISNFKVQAGKTIDLDSNSKGDEDE